MYNMNNEWLQQIEGYQACRGMVVGRGDYIQVIASMLLEGLSKSSLPPVSTDLTFDR